MKKEIKDYATWLSNYVDKVIKQINLEAEEGVSKLKTLHFKKFTNEEPFEGHLTNLIFFTYSNHYKYNSGVWLEAENLNHAHLSYEDRGYIKGIAVDLHNYLLIRSVFTEVSIESTQHYALSLKAPRFNKTKHSETYKQQVKDIQSEEWSKVDKALQEKRDKLNATAKEITGLSLGYYLVRPI